jgi:hypothetical protein
MVFLWQEGVFRRPTPLPAITTASKTLNLPQARWIVRVSPANVTFNRWYSAFKTQIILMEDDAQKPNDSLGKVIDIHSLQTATENIILEGGAGHSLSDLKRQRSSDFHKA